MDAWLARTGHRRGGSMPLATMWTLARRWYAGRLDEAWRRRTAEEVNALLDEVGLTDPFWRV